MGKGHKRTEPPAGGSEVSMPARPTMHRFDWSSSELQVSLPRKRLYRARAHSNPLNDNQFLVPPCPAAYNWRWHFQEFLAAHSARQQVSGGAAAVEPPQVQFADVGCGFGGLLISLAPLYPDTLMVGMEIRDKVTNYVIERVAALRKQQPGAYTNITALRTNAMRYLPCFFAKGQLTKLFFLFPDPHFKHSNHRRRIVQASLLAEYAYCMAPGGMLYTITDVPELGQWMHDKLEAHPLFERVSDAELADDPAAQQLPKASEEAQKVARNEGQTYRNVYRRVPDPI